MWLRRLLIAACVPVGLILVGTAGYYEIEGWSLFDSLYMTVITLTTIGYGETHPLSTGGRWFTMVLGLGGIFSLFFAATEMIRAVVSGELGALLGRQRMERNLARLNDHLIVCGYGRMGRYVCREFAAQKIPYVVIDRSADHLAECDGPSCFPLQGDATSDEVLLRAGVDRARALVTVVASDADNLFITMSARLQKEKLFIVARAEDEAAVEKMKRAGANRVISPYSIGGHRVAQAVLRPSVLDFIELATRHGERDLQIEETRIAPGSKLVGQTIAGARFRQELGVAVMVIRKPEGQMLVSPEAETALAAEDILILLGPRDQLDKVDELARGTPA